MDWTKEMLLDMEEEASDVLREHFESIDKPERTRLEKEYNYIRKKMHMINEQDPQRYDEAYDYVTRDIKVIRLRVFTDDLVKNF